MQGRAEKDKGMWFTYPYPQIIYIIKSKETLIDHWTEPPDATIEGNYEFLIGRFCAFASEN